MEDVRTCNEAYNLVELVEDMEDSMLNDPLSLSREGLAALPDEELATKINDTLKTIADMKDRGEDVSVQEKVYEAYVDEYNHRSQNDTPTKPHGIKRVE